MFRKTQIYFSFTNLYKASRNDRSGSPFLAAGNTPRDATLSPDLTYSQLQPYVGQESTPKTPWGGSRAHLPRGPPNMAGLLRGTGRNSPRGSSPEAVVSLGGFPFLGGSRPAKGQAKGECKGPVWGAQSLGSGPRDGAAGCGGTEGKTDRNVEVARPGSGPVSGSSSQWTRWGFLSGPTVAQGQALVSRAPTQARVHPHRPSGLSEGPDGTGPHL